MDKYLALIKHFENSEWLLDENDLVMGDKLGDGASGTTYVGQFRGEKVAIKSYSVTMLIHDINSVKNEMDILSTMRHSNIVQFRGLVLRRNKPCAYLVTKFAERGELGDALYKSYIVRRRGNSLRFQIVLGLARGLKYLHSNNVIHRDIKPANILLDDNYEPLLTDFGFSRFIESDSDNKMTGQTGSYRYMAPEITQQTHYTAKADVYSFALICNEIFCNEMPYEYQIAIVVAVDVVKKGLRPSSTKIKNARLKELVHKCWKQDPDQRPDWDYIIDELEAIQKEMGAGPGAKKSKGFRSFFRSRGASAADNSSSGL